jgi:hypothetical protein
MLKFPYTTQKITQTNLSYSNNSIFSQTPPWLPPHKSSRFEKIKIPASHNPWVTYEDGYTDLLSSPSFTWDWGRPGYCRQQLLALGFTAAEFTESTHRPCSYIECTR